ncbi:MAG: transferase hexapeptide protein [Sphaerisporangium sp.]|jgi:carbonic anhydrase/acetyltransferase-like protein (isoleucine patch superfamily)|nr:transferase hexapeptide protein [Sphaerisporangium sp.]
MSEPTFPGPAASPYIAALDECVPSIHPEAYVAPTAVVVGRVRLGRATSVWYGSVLRGDDEAIEVDEECNIQDLCCLHSDPGLPAVLESRVSLGHRAMVHGAHIESGVLVGIGAIVLNGARIGAGSLVAAGCVVTPGKKIPAGVLVAGVPGTIVRELTDRDRATFARTPDNYMAKAALHRAASPLPAA